MQLLSATVYSEIKQPQFMVLPVRLLGDCDVLERSEEIEAGLHFLAVCTAFQMLDVLVCLCKHDVYKVCACKVVSRMFHVEDSCR